MNEIFDACEQRRNFVLIDLRSQLGAVRKYTSGWTSNDVLRWLQIYGDVVDASKSGWRYILKPYHLIFVPKVLPFLAIGFYFDDAENLTISGVLLR